MSKPERAQSDFIFRIADEISELANVSDKRRAMDIAQVSITAYLIGAALDGAKSIGTISRAIEQLTRKVFDPEVIDGLKPADAIRLLDRAIELYRTQVDVARQVTKETNWDRLAGLITELTLYEEAGSRGLDDDLIRAIAEELASRLDHETAMKVLSAMGDSEESKKSKGVKRVRRVKRAKEREKEGVEKSDGEEGDGAT